MWLGFDLGTQSVRAMAVSEMGHVLGQSSQPLTSRREGPRHEQDPEEWWRAIVYVSRMALADLPASAVRGLAVDGTSGTILLINRSGKALTPGLMYDDTRAKDEAHRTNEAGAAVWSSLGYRMQPSWGLPKLLWLLREHASVIPGARLAHQNDFINCRFSGHEVPSDSSNALKTGYDLVREAWPHEVLDSLGVPDPVLPAVVRSGTQLGTVCAEAAEMTGIPAGTPIIAGMTDGCAAQIGAGALEVGSWNSVLGTTLVLKGVTSELIRDPAGVMYSHRSPDGNWLPGGASSTGAAVLAQQFPGRDLDALSAQAANREPASVIAYPLVSRGERFPFVAPNAEGFVLGNPTDQVDLYAALLQGVAFIERLCFDYLDMLGVPIDGTLTFTGGAARNRYWCQLRADILGRPIRLLENAEPALGMAILAASVGCRISDVAKDMVHIRSVIDCRANRFARFQKSYLRLVEELARRGWLQSAVAEHARSRAGIER
ncbi:MAG: FGGY-family carbohydrate kinase [Candidatus Korobacteraceae bacterium]|jgi:sugar (pentulose or hexulose) kinase